MRDKNAVPEISGRRFVVSNHLKALVLKKILLEIYSDNHTEDFECQYHRVNCFGKVLKEFMKGY